MESQGRDWACNVIGDCPSTRGRHCILQKNGKGIWSVKKDMIEKKGKNKYITSEIG
jgi:hypothetical protein